MSDRVLIYDTTLRDGVQGAGVSFSLPDKLRVAQKLDQFGIDYVEGGWPGSNPKDVIFFERILDAPVNHSKIAAFGSTRRANISADDDANLKQLVAAKTPVATIFGKSWMFHVSEVLRTTAEENLLMIGDSVAYLKAHVDEVIYDAEHFFDGYKDDPEYALKTLRSAVESGSDWLVLCDTNGGSLPEEISEITAAVTKQFSEKCSIGIHSHNDGGLGVANALAAVQSGARQVQGTVNGYGERTGNADLCSVLPNLKLKLGFSVLGDDAKLRELTSVSRTISELANLEPDERLPYVGVNSFTHKGGTHVNAMLKTTRSFEHIEPEEVGNRRRYLVSELSGKSNLLQKSEELGFEFSGTQGETEQILDQLKKLEFQGYEFEDADASFELLVQRSQGIEPQYFETRNYEVHVRCEEGESTSAAAQVKIRVGEREVIEEAEGAGPVSALDNALRKALISFYPSIENMKLIDYKVRILERERGTAAKPRVIITSRSGTSTWNTVGVSYDILEASWQALVDSYVYGLINTGVSEQENMKKDSVRLNL
jgi:2-isopropylmalate synthase